MRIGVLTFHRAVNPGAFLQAYAMLRVLEEEGHDVTILDWGTQHWVAQEIRSRVHGNRGIRRITSLAEIYRYFRLQAKYLAPKNANGKVGAKGSADFDAIVLGSDEIWNLDNFFSGYRAELFGVGLNCRRLISYAPSFGALSDVSRIPAAAVSSLTRFHAISVRDVHSRQLVRAKLSRDCPICCDPTLLYDFPECKREFAFRPFALVYVTRLAAEELNSLRSYARAEGLDVRFAGCWSPKGDFCEDHPFRVLSLFRDASAVIANTFHGVTLAAKFKRPIAVIGNAEKSNKLRCTLERFSIPAPLINVTESAIDASLSSAPDYRWMPEFVGFSRSFLLDSLQSSVTMCPSGLSPSGQAGQHT